MSQLIVLNQNVHMIMIVRLIKNAVETTVGHLFAQKRVTIWLRHISNCESLMQLSHIRVPSKIKAYPKLIGTYLAGVSQFSHDSM